MKSPKKTRRDRRFINQNQSFYVDFPGSFSEYGMWFGTEYSQTYTTDSAFAMQAKSGIRRPKPKKLFIEPTDYFFERVRSDNPTGTANMRYTGLDGIEQANYYQSGTFGSNTMVGNIRNLYYQMWNPYEGFPERLRSSAIIKARNKLSSSDIDLAVAFGERNQTARYVGDVTRRVAKFVNMLARRRFSDAFDALGLTRKRVRGGSIHELWLETQYAVKPLYRDVHGALQSLAETDVSNWKVTAKATEKRRTVRNISDGKFSLCSCDVLESAFVRIDAVPKNDLLISLQETGVTNPAALAWELLPFSFVADWFIPVGDWLNSLDALLGYEGITSSVSCLTKASFRATGISTTETSVDGGTWSYSGAFTGREERVRLHRLAYIDEAPQAVMPVISLSPSSLNHMASGISLLTAAVSKALS